MTAFVRNEQLRRRHIATALRFLGGNRATARRLTAHLGATIPENRVASWKRDARVPFRECLALAELTRGKFKPERVRKSWGYELHAFEQAFVSQPHEEPSTTAVANNTAEAVEG